VTEQTGESVVVPRRFRGPATSGNGGWTSGSLAEVLAPAPNSLTWAVGALGIAEPPARAGRVVRVRLSAPPPLELPMTVVHEGRTVVAQHDGRPVLTATLLADDEAAGLDPVPPVPYETALAAGERYAGLRDHPFPECFACGPARAPDDGLRLRPGPPDPAVAGVDVAAAWAPGEADVEADGGVPVPIVWAALDCPGGWSIDVVGRPMVLGTMTARVWARPGYEERCVVTGRAVEVGERKSLTATSLYGQSGDLLATAAHIWVAVDPATFGRAGAGP
jgi:hypothetical protein